MDPTLDSKPASEPVKMKKWKKIVRLPPSTPCALVSYKELPEYMKDNEFILSYYRANWPLKGALFSIFRWHNETLNVWTTTSNNLIDLKPESESDVTRVTRWPFYVFLAGSMFCLLSSTICHLFSCHSHHLNLSLLRLDYAGITAMIITSFFPPIYYIFQCDPQWHFVYLGGITVLGLFTIATLLSPALSTKKFRGFRALLFSSMALFGIIPGIHAAVVNWSNPRSNVTLAYELAMAMFYLTGTLFYISRIPERFKPGWFDLAGHSHQIFHILVVMGALAHYGASLVFPDWLDRHSC
ncbi:Heptahelical transmembrane protein 1 [Hibiscus syriacus]|uniref:Heptahelical transmembrane protein 1 n=1 Tax=Hibiscus syriacus TaxID=106335 RepID=A0A6A2YJ85_HIBSY|nr:Heptahelical transmembrane protein 1 [Hibiscus syriacus]